MAYTTIKKPSDYFNTVTYTASGSGQSVTGVNFQPDLVWLKIRNSAGSHYLNDSVRGVQKSIYSNEPDAEASDNYVTSFDSDGFSLGSGNYTSPNTIVGWNWLAANSTASNTDGSITSTVSANTTSGFSIVKWTQSSGATFGHGLNQAPEIFIHKRTSNTGQWVVFTDITGSIQYLELNSTIASSSTSVTWDSTTFTNFTGDTGDWISYCFHSVKGFSKIGSYTGNGSTDGTFVYTGFKPAMVIMKNSSTATNWHIYDNKRTNNASNPTDDILFANSSSAESTDSSANPIDFLSNGFKCRGTNSASNSSGNTFIYMAFAEEPLVGDNPATAR